MRLYVQRRKGNYRGEPIDRFFSHDDSQRSVAMQFKTKFYRLSDEATYENLEIGQAQSFTGTTELVRIA